MTHDNELAKIIEAIPEGGTWQVWQNGDARQPRTLMLFGAQPVSDDKVDLILAVLSESD